MRSRDAIVYAAAAIFAATLVARFYRLGPPYFDRPETIQDHVSREPHPSRQAIVLARRASLIIPRGKSVTVLLPSQAPNHDPTLYFTATGYMPHHTIIDSNLNRETGNPEYVISIKEPLEHPQYELMTEYPEGRIYRRK